SIEQAFPARNSKFSNSIEHPPWLDSNSKFSIEQGSLQDSTRFELDRAKGSAQLELDMFDVKAYIVEISCNLGVPSDFRTLTGRARAVPRAWGVRHGARPGRHGYQACQNWSH